MYVNHGIFQMGFQFIPRIKTLIRYVRKMPTSSLKLYMYVADELRVHFAAFSNSFAQIQFRPSRYIALVIIEFQFNLMNRYGMHWSLCLCEMKWDKGTKIKKYVFYIIPRHYSEIYKSPVAMFQEKKSYFQYFLFHLIIFFT